jgi:hypothetical protein
MGGLCPAVTSQGPWVRSFVLVVVVVFVVQSRQRVYLR